eukprot:TRINITY_DN3647_c0_g5_i2.p4 TRINITY_DN3647_c0_g5~~TRINITY_DN3647_c0_g5_i2.p4  ORF type:complete len:209 (-),score=91.18 TRINITY_DN3647_c0_g5_i2:168-794(-)
MCSLTQTRRTRNTSQRKVLPFPPLARQKKAEAAENPLMAKKRKQETDDLWKQLNAEESPKKKKTEPLQSKEEEEKLAKEALEALKAMKETGKPVVQEKVRFAGEVFTYEKRATEKDLKKQEREARTQLRGRQGGLDSIMTKLQGSKGINAVDKSKKDWKKYVEKSNLEKELAQNRKDGFMAKQKFLADAEKAEREKTKPSRPLQLGKK